MSAHHRTGRSPGRPPMPKSDLVPTPGQKGLVRAHSAATAAAKETFLRALAECGSISGACRACDRARRTVHGWRDADAAFAAKWDDALEQAVATLEREAWRRAVEGTEEPVVSGGKVLTTVRRYSDSLLKALLVAHAPEKYSRSGTQIAIAAAGTNMTGITREADSRLTFTLNIFGDGRNDVQRRLIEAEPAMDSEGEEE